MPSGKAGTLTAEDFTKLKALAATYGGKTLALKVAKVCTKSAAPLSHEFPGSLVAKAFTSTAKKITDKLGAGAAPVSGAAFSDVSKMVSRYGAEIVVMKLAKIAKKNNDVATATSLKSIFIAA